VLVAALAAGRASAAVPAAAAPPAVSTRPAAAAEAPVDPARREQVRHLLSGYEYVPTAAELQAIPELDRVLESLATDAATPGFVRARALSSFAALPASNERANRVLRAAVADEGLHPQLRRAAVKTLVTRLGAAALPDVLPLLSHREVRLRDAAVEALAVRAADPAVRDALASRLPAEREPAIRDRIAGLLEVRR
jgi:HEAT repeat protein